MLNKRQVHDGVSRNKRWGPYECSAYSGHIVKRVGDKNLGVNHRKPPKRVGLIDIGEDKL